MPRAGEYPCMLPEKLFIHIVSRGLWPKHREVYEILCRVLTGEKIRLEEIAKTSEEAVKALSELIKEEVLQVNGDGVLTVNPHYAEGRIDEKYYTVGEIAKLLNIPKRDIIRLIILSKIKVAAYSMEYDKYIIHGSEIPKIVELLSSEPGIQRQAN